MNIENLRAYVGRKVKNYPEMCRILEEDIKDGGNSKPAQLANWSRYFKYEREKNKFIITEIYNEPLPDKDGRSNGNNSKYVEFIEKILVSYLVKKDEKTDTMSQNKWFIVLGMVNPLFNNDSYNLKLLENTNQYSLNQFYLTANEKLHDIFISALNNMKKRKVINWKGKVSIVPVNGGEYIASEIELGLIKGIESLAMNEFECANMFDINRKGIRKKYFSKCNELVRKKYQWDRYYKLIYIELINHDIIDIWEDKIHDNKMILNSQVVNGINSAIKAKV